MTAGEGKRALAYAERAARLAVQASAFRTGMDHYRRALQIAPLGHHLEPFENCHFFFGASWFHSGAIARRLGLLAALLDRLDEAERLLREGIKRDARMGAPAFVARGRVALARVVRRRGGRGARAEVEALLEDASRETDRLGLQNLRRDIDALRAG